MLASREQSSSIVTMLLTFLLSSVVLKMVMGDIPLGDQHCGDPKCLEPISVGRTVLKYRANSNLMLSFNPSTPVKIFSKDMNDGGEIWGVEIEGKRGFVNRRHIQETRIFKSQLGHRVTEGNGSNSESNEPVNYVVDKNSDRPSEPENIEKNISIESPKQNQYSDNSEEILNPVKETVAEETKDKERLDTSKEPVNKGRYKGLASQENTTQTNVDNVNDSKDKKSVEEESHQNFDSQESMDSQKVLNKFDENNLSIEVENTESSVQDEIEANLSKAKGNIDESTQGTTESLESSQKSGESIIVSPHSDSDRNTFTDHTDIEKGSQLPFKSHNYTKNVLPPSVAKVLSYTGAHATQINVSPEDVEYNKILDGYHQANFSSLPSVTSSILKFIQTSATAALQSQVDVSQISSLFVTPSSVSDDENVQLQQTQSTYKEEATQTLNSEAAEAELPPSDNFEVIDGTTIYMKPETIANIKSTSNMIESSIIPSSSLMAASSLQNEKMLSSTLMSTTPIAADDKSKPTYQSDDLPANDALKYAQKDEDGPSAQGIKLDTISSSTVDIQPSITEQVHESMSVTPELSQNNMKVETNEHNIPPPLQDFEATNNLHVVNTIPDMHVSTENAADSKKNSDSNEDSPNIDVDETNSHKLSSNELPLVPSTEIPTIHAKPSGELESSHFSQPNFAEKDTENVLSEEKVRSTTSEPNTLINNEETKMTDDTSNHETSQDEFEDVEDQDDEEDDDEFESEEIKEERKMIIQQSLQNESESIETELNDEIQPDKDTETNEISDTISEGNLPPIDIDKSDNVDIDSQVYDHDETNTDLNKSNEDNDLFENMPGTSADGSIEVEQNEGKPLDTKAREQDRTEEISENDIVQPSIDEKTETLDDFKTDEIFERRPGDDIKFYEPGDMIPDDKGIKSSDDYLSQNEDVISANHVTEATESEHVDAKTNDFQATEKACCRALTAECLSCAAEMSISEYCAINIDTVGCEEDQVNAKNVQHENLQGTDITSEQPLVQEPTPSYLNNEVINTDEPHREEMEKTDHEVTNVETPIEMNSRETEEFAMNTESEVNSDISSEKQEIDSFVATGNTDEDKENTEIENTEIENNDLEHILEISPHEEYATGVDDNVGTNSKDLSFSQDIFLHIIESLKDITPEWLHKSMHGENVEDVSPKLVFLLLVISISLLTLHIVSLIFDKVSREKPLLAKIASLDKALFKARNELMIVRRELDEARSKMSYKETVTAKTEDYTKSTVVDSIKKESPARSNFQQPPAHLLKEIETLKVEKDKYEKETQSMTNQNQEIIKSLEIKTEEAKKLEIKLEDTCKELKEAENMVKEVLQKERERQQASKNQDELVQAIDTLRIQLDNQKKSVQKYESKIAKRETELKGKVQEVRKLRADAANANLAVDKVTLEKENLSKIVEEHKLKEEDMERKLKELEEELIDFNNTKSQLSTVQDNLDIKESELETTSREVAILKETLQSLTDEQLGKRSSAPAQVVESSLRDKDNENDNGSNEDDGDGWDNQSFDGFGDEDSSKSGADVTASIDDNVTNESKASLESSNQIDNRIVAAVQEMAQYKVDLSKATEACSQLNSQLTVAEGEKTRIANQLSDNEKELQIARAAKDEAVRVKIEIEQKHQVLTDYYNQREAELQKQLGLLSSKLGDANEGSESSAKKLTHLFEELESYKSQCKSYKAEMEEQERSLKSQNALLEKRHHESWVTVRQESRKNADAQNEMQTLRNRLTVAETKLLEREVEIKNYEDENKTLKDAMENLVEKASVSSNKSTNQQLINDGNFTNGASLIDGIPVIGARGANGISSSEGGSLTGNGANDVDVPPPDLPPLPMPSMPHAVYPHVPVVPPMGLGVIPPQFQTQQQTMSNFPADIMRRPPPLGRRSPPRGGGGQMYSRSPSPPPNDERYTHKNGRRHNISSSARSDTSNRGRTRHDRGSEYDSYGTSGVDYSPPPSPRYSHKHSQMRRSSKHSPDRYSSRSGQSGSEWTDREYYENDKSRRRDHKSGTPMRDERNSEKRKQRPYVENGEAFEDEHHGYASGSSSYRDRTNHHSKRRENVAGEDSLRERIQGKHGPKTSSPMV